MKAWRRRSTTGTVAGESCGLQPSAPVLESIGGGQLHLGWVWTGGGLEPGTIEESEEGSGIWTLVSEVEPLGFGESAWFSNVPIDSTAIARIRRSGSAEACAVVSNSAVVA